MVGMLKIWDGTEWKSAGVSPTITVQASAPSLPATGQLWYDSDEPDSEWGYAIPDARLPARLQAGPVIISNFNNATESGFYTGDSTTTNVPTSSWWFLTVIKYSGGDLFQRVTELTNTNDAPTYERQRNSAGTWSGWLRTGGPWRTYTPTWAGGTVGNASRSGRYTQLGKTIHFVAAVTLGSTSGAPAAPIISLPFDSNVSGLFNTFNVSLIDANGSVYNAMAYNGAGSGWASLFVTGTNGVYTSISSSVPFTWVSGDSMHVSGTYEVA